MKKLVPLSIVSAIIPFLSLAHEGHGHTHGFTITHYFVEPEHLVSIIYIAAGKFYFGRMRKKEINGD